MACAMRLLEFENEREKNRMLGFELAVRKAISEAINGPTKTDSGSDTPAEISEDDIM